MNTAVTQTARSPAPLLPRPCTLGRARERPPYVADGEAFLVVGTIDFDDSIDAAVLARCCVPTASGRGAYRKLGRNQLRIGMFPAIDSTDVVTLTKAIDHVLDSGVAAK